MKHVGLMMVGILSAVQAQAIHDPQWERPIQNAEMKIMTAQRAFTQVKDVNLTLTRRDKALIPTGMILSFKPVLNSVKGLPKTKIVKVALKITQAEKAGCGSVRYYASLPQKKNQKYVGHRFSVVLVDHSQRVCEDYRPYLWEASVREGYGWCGTMDSTMSIAGNPKAVITIQ